MSPGKLSPTVVMPIVVIGVSASGKSVLAAKIAQTLGWTFVEGDDLHPASNIEKMAKGIALTDEDRLPFLQNIAARLGEKPNGAVAACSALKRSYRDLIRQAVGAVLFVYPEVCREELERRLKARPGHFMPPSLLDSQLQTFEPLADEELSITLDWRRPLSEQVALVRNELEKIVGVSAGLGGLHV